MNGLKANKDNPFDVRMFEALDSIRLDEEAAQRIWEDIEASARLGNLPHAESHRKAFHGALAVAAAVACICVVAVLALNSMPSEVVSQSLREDQGSVMSDSVVLTDSTIGVQGSQQSSVHALRRWIIPLSDGIVLMTRIQLDGNPVLSSENELGDCLGDFVATDLASGDTSKCKMYRHAGSEGVYVVRFEEEGLLCEAVISEGAKEK